MTFGTRKFLGRWIAAVASFLAIGGLLAADFAGESSTSKALTASRKTDAPLVSVVEARKMTFIDTVLVTGSLVPREEILVGPEIDGYRIVSLLAEEGDRVKAGQVLALLSRDILEAQLAQNEASAARALAAIDQVHNQISESEATLRQAEEAFNRVKPLRQSGVASQATFEEREAAYRAARARLAAQKEGLRLVEAEQKLIEAQRKELEIKLGRTGIKSPADGIVSRRVARIGAVSSSTSDALFRIIRDGEVELDAEVPEFDMPKLKPGQNAQIEIQGVGERHGTVRLVSQEVNPSSRLGHVRIVLGKGPDLRIGTFAKGTIDASRHDEVGVPATALLYQNDAATVLAVKDDRVHERPVKTGLRAGEFVEIKDGLGQGDVVVLRAGSLLRDGDIIEPQFMESRTAEQITVKETAK